MSASSERLVLVHGFTQTAASWSTLTRELVVLLGRDVEVVAVDAPGHGTRSDVRADLAGGAALLATEGRATYVGYSMGGRMCLHLALARPELVERLVLIGAHPGIEDGNERAERRAADDALADTLEQIGVAAFVERWLRSPLFATLPADAADIEHRLGNTVDGLASSLRLAGTGAQEPLWDRLGELAMPVLVVAGELDEKFCALGRRLADRIAGATFAEVAGAGHAAHLEQPAAVARLIATWSGDHPPMANPTDTASP